MSMLKTIPIKLSLSRCACARLHHRRRRRWPALRQADHPADLAPWDISIGPDGAGLPPGSGTPAQGAIVYVDNGCQACHGDNGSGGVAGPARRRWSAQRHRPRSGKPIGNYWPYATTIFDFVRRAMPWQQPKTLTDNEVYARHGLHPRAQQDHRRGGRDECRDAAESKNAEPRRLHHPVPGETLTGARMKI